MERTGLYCRPHIINTLEGKMSNKVNTENNKEKSKRADTKDSHSATSQTTIQQFVSVEWRLNYGVA